MDFILWLRENNIQYSLKPSASSYLFTLLGVSASDGILYIGHPCMLGRTPYNAVNLFILSYEGFVLTREGYKPLLIWADRFEVKTIPEVLDIKE